MDQQELIIKDKAQIINLLHRLHQAHSQLSLRTQHTDAPQNSLIVALMADEDYFLVDAITDPLWHNLIKPSTMLDIGGRLEGVKIDCRTNVQAVITEDSSSSYKLSFPAQINYKQRRRHFRARVENQKSISISLPLSLKQLIHGVVVDISAGGLCSRVDLVDASTLSLEQAIPQARIALPGAPTLTCDLALRNVRHFPEKGYSLIGGEFLHIAPHQQHHVERLVATLDRTRRRANGTLI